MIASCSYLRFPLLGRGFFRLSGVRCFGGSFGGTFGGTLLPGARGGTARIKHFGPEPIKSSRCAFKSASRTR